MKKTCTFFCCNYIPTKGPNQRQLIFKAVNIPNDVFFALQLTDMNTSILKHRSLSLRAWPIRAHHIARPVDVFNKRLLKRQRPDNPCHIFPPRRHPQMVAKSPPNWAKRPNRSWKWDIYHLWWTGSSTHLNLLPFLGGQESIDLTYFVYGLFVLEETVW